MEQGLKIKAMPRTLRGEKLKQLRARGSIPAVVYGHRIPTALLAVDRKEFESVYTRSGESTLMQLMVDQETPRTVLIHEVQRHSVTHELAHVDFYQVDMRERIKATVALVFEGESKAVKDLGGVLVKNVTAVEVEALPGDLPPSISVDISTLATFEDSVQITDLRVNHDKVRILARPYETVAKVTPPRSEDELKALEEKPVEAVAAVEGLVKEPVSAEGEAETAEKKKE